MKISIITSAFNSEKTIKKTIDSVIAQSFKDWEMIIVNDCSTDSTIDVINTYTDSRIKLISHDINKGAGLARRTGLEHIKGEYMTFLDSDDYLKPDYLEKLITAILTYNVDIVSSGLICVDALGNVLEERIPDKIIQENGAKFKPNKQDTKRFMNPMLIRSSLWDKVTYSSRRFIEDTPTLVQILYWARNIMLIDYAGYYYVQNPTSLVHSSSKLKYLIYQTLCIKDMTLFFKSVGKENLSNNTQFKKQYTMIQGLCTKDDRIKYKSELKELENYYNKLKEDK